MVSGRTMRVVLGVGSWGGVTRCCHVSCRFVSGGQVCGDWPLLVYPLGGVQAMG